MLIIIMVLPKGVREVSDGAHFSFMWLKQCILIATRISKSFNVVFKHCSVRAREPGDEAML